MGRWEQVEKMIGSQGKRPLSQPKPLGGWGAGGQPGGDTAATICSHLALFLPTNSSALYIHLVPVIATGTHLCCSCFSAVYFTVRVPGATAGPDQPWPWCGTWFPGSEAWGLSAFTSCGESWALPPRKTHMVENSLNLGSGFRYLAANKW